MWDPSHYSHASQTGLLEYGKPQESHCYFLEHQLIIGLGEKVLFIQQIYLKYLQCAGHNVQGAEKMGEKINHLA